MTDHGNAGLIDVSDPLGALRCGRETAWLRPMVSDASGVTSSIPASEIDEAAHRLRRFAPVLAHLFADQRWDGQICSPLLDWPEKPGWMVKGDHDLPVTGSIKARGGVHALLHIIEQIAAAEGLAIDELASPFARTRLSCHRVIVASTGNLGFSIGIVARTFGLEAEIHMSLDAKSWKKDRLRALGARVVEHRCDYSETLSRARLAANFNKVWLIDDEHCRDLLTGYAAASDEVASQLVQRGVAVDADHPLIVYLPCGVGGAPGGITHGLKRRFGRNVITVFVEPVASPCMLVALASGRGAAATVYDYGCSNVTLADGLAVPQASQLVLDAVGGAIDAVVAVSDARMVQWVGRAWHDGRIRLEPSAASALAAFAPLQQALARQSGWPDLGQATHLFWATGGSKLPDEEFQALLEAAN